MDGQESLYNFFGSEEVLAVNNDGIVKVYGDIPLNIPNASTLSIIRNDSIGIHSLGNPHPAKFIPELPRWAIRKFSKDGDTILDPFVGSGTTLVEAVLEKRNSYGIDVNPLACLISKVKCTPLNIGDLRRYRDTVFEEISKNLHTIPQNIPEFKNRDFWFDRQVSEILTIIRNCINEYIIAQDIHDFFMVSLSETAQRVSKVANGQILPAARTKSMKEKTFSKEDVVKNFVDQVSKNTMLIEEFSIKAPKNVFSKIIGKDARKLSPPTKVDLIITSPPYINAHHYIWTYKLRLMQLGLVSDAVRKELMVQEIGSEENSAKDYSKLHDFGIKELDEKIAQIYSGQFYKATGHQNKIRAYSTYRFFVDMQGHFKQAYEILQTGSKYCLVIGDSNSICKVKIPTADYLTSIAESIGFKKIFDFQIVLKNRTLNMPRNVGWSDTIQHDKMIVFERR